LQVLLNIKSACEEAVVYGCEYQEYEKKCQREFVITEKQRKYQEWYSMVSNIIGSVLESKSAFPNSLDTWEQTRRFLIQEVNIPNNLRPLFSEGGCVSLDRVLRIARNHQEHPEKTDQIRYLLLADSIPSMIILQALCHIWNLVVEEWNSLSEDERIRVIVRSTELKRNMVTIQQCLMQLVPAFSKDPRVKPEVYEQLMQMIEFVPSDENIIAVYNESKANMR
jgi:hypothetical protein